MASVMGNSISLQVDTRQLQQALENLSPEVSALVVGLHGIGKSQVARGIAQTLRNREPEYDWPTFDVRLSLFTEGDIVGIPDQDRIAEHRVTCFLPVDWVAKACDQPAVIFLDEINRAETQIQNSAFQLILERELNGNKLHPKTRIFAACNPPGYYNVTDLDVALVDRFLVLNLKMDHQRWLEWARGRLDDAVVDFIAEMPMHLMNPDPGTIGQLEVSPTPRSWEKLDVQLKFAGMAPTDVQGKPLPELFGIYCHGLLGLEAANTFIKWLENRKRFLAVEDVADLWSDPAKGPAIKQLAKSLRHEEHLATLDKIVKWADHKLEKRQIDNITDYALTCLSGEDMVILFIGISGHGLQENTLGFHANRKLMDVVLGALSAQRKIEEARDATAKGS